MARLPIRPEHSNLLRITDSNIVEAFNQFDIDLKAKFNGVIVDLIDYDAGTVTLVKPRGASQHA